MTGFETYTFEEMRAAVDTAHQFEKKIAIHSYGPEGARDAVRAEQFGGARYRYGWRDDSGDGEARIYYVARWITIATYR